MKIDNNILLNLIKNQWNKPVIEGYQVVENNITSSDPEDGGADHEMIIKDVEENKYFLLYYCDWDVQNEEIDNELLEVVPQQEMVTVYKPLI